VGPHLYHAVLSFLMIGVVFEVFAGFDEFGEGVKNHQKQ
jgi:hypothetical protein